MLQFHLLKYLKFEDLIKFKLICKNAGHLADANFIQEETDIFAKLSAFFCFRK